MKRFLCLCLVLVMVFTLPGVTTLCVTALSSDSAEAQLIGYGFNVTAGKALSKGNLQYAYPILDTSNPELFNKIHVVDIQETKAQNIVAYSALELAESIGNTYAGGIEGKISAVTVDIGLQFDKSQTISNAVSEKYEMYYQQILRRQVIIQMDSSELTNYLSSKFSKELHNVNSEADAIMLLQKYGTHLMTGYTLGGRMDLTNYQVTSDASKDLSSGTSLKTKIGAAVSYISAGVNFSISQQYAAHENTATQRSTYNFSCIGGESVTGLTLDQLFTYNSSMVDGNGNYVYDRWVRSINAGTNLDIIGLASGGQAIPIWELLEKSSENMKIRNLLISAYVKLCGDKYTEYCNQYPYLYTEIADEQTSPDETYGVIEGYYTAFASSDSNLIINGPNEIDEDGIEISVSCGAIVYFDAFDSILLGKKNWTIISGNANGEILDANNGVFKATGNAGAEFIVAICDENTELDRITVKIKQKAFSGGTGAKEDPFIISTPEDMQELLSNGQYFNNANYYYKLINDIDISGIKINSAMDYSYCFRGVFDGNYCTLSGFEAKTDTNYAIKEGSEIHVGLFGVNAGTIRNLTVQNCTFKLNDANAKYYKVMTGGVLVGTNYGKIENCVVKDSTMYIKKSASIDTYNKDERLYQINCGGMVGRLVGSIYNSGVINSIDTVALADLNKNLKATDDALTGKTAAGGLVGYMDADAYIEGCFTHFRHGNSSGDQTSRVMAQTRGDSSQSNYKTFGFAYAGGLVGWAEKGNSSTNSAAIFYCVVDSPSNLLAGLQFCKDENKDSTDADRRAGVVIGKNTAIASINFRGNVSATSRTPIQLIENESYKTLFINWIYMHNNTL